MDTIRTHDRLWLGLATLGLLLPFIGKAFHIDDPIFLWTAEQVSVHPFDFFGFDVNWYGVVEPMYEVNKNPPLTSYFIALIAAIGGWSEVSLHLGMLLPALGLALGIHALASRLCGEPLLAALVAVTTPVFVLSATSLMSDVAMLCLWVWSCVLFLRGLDGDDLPSYLLAGVGIGLCVITKYFGLALIPLLLVHGALRKRAPGRWLVSLGLALLIIVCFDFATRSLYGFGPLLDVMDYATSPDVVQAAGPLQRAAIGLFFLGGCTLGSLLWMPRLWSSKGLSLLVPLLGIGVAGLVQLFATPTFPFDLSLQQALMGFAGLHLVALTVVDLVNRKDADATLLALWIFGVLIFASFTNWTTNGRSILPAIPAVGILVARALQANGGARWAVAAPILVASSVLSLLVAQADAQLAGSARSAAEELSVSARSEAGALYFQGSWGFQRHMELAGVERMAIGETVLNAGDRIVMAGNNSNVYRLPPNRSRLIRVEQVPKSSWIAIMSRARSAGFYASVWGTLPYSFGEPGTEQYGVYEMTGEWAPQRRGNAGQPRKAEAP